MSEPAPKLKDRTTLKSFFTQGNVPTEEDFSDLIDSTLNMADEGFSKTDKHGFEIVLPRGKSNAITLLLQEERKPVWRIALDQSDGAPRLYIDTHVGEGHAGRPAAGGARDDPPVLTLTAEGYVGINCNSPARELDVGGVIKAVGRTGVVPKRLSGDSDQGNGVEQPVPADGEWHNITLPLYGCHAFEVVACAKGPKGEGDYALMHAIAMNTFNPRGWFFNFLGMKNRIKASHAYYRRRSDKLELRWKQHTREHYLLQVRSRRNYGPGVEIKYHVTQLWHDERLEEVIAPQRLKGQWLPRMDEEQAAIPAQTGESNSPE